ncbi:cupredoxin domain-containing protein [Trujillonella humicola]|uniref:cupredoxin domain-containing protein n=1 Tax=Trujillonella humicola TaxID=3383699 RepID=UPI003905900E
MSSPTGSTRTARRLAAALVAVALGLLSACGGDDDGGDDTAAATTEATTEATPTASETTAGEGGATGGSEQQAGGTLAVTSVDFDYELDSDQLAAGDYTIELTNGGSATHDLVVEQDGAEVARTDTIGPGETDSLDVTLEPGEYVFFCSVGNHRSMGMEVTVTVT